MNRLSSFIFAIAAFVAMPASAQGVIADLHAHRFEAVERPLQAADEDFQAHRISELDLLDAYKVFYMDQDILSEDLAAWERARPASWVAHLASGTYHRKLGEIRRGQGYMQAAPPEDQRYMMRQFDLARVELERALEMNPRSYLAMLNLLNIAQFVDDDTLANRMLALGNRARPDNLLIRARYVIHLTPRWGGSLVEMDAFIEATRKSRAPADVVQLLEAVGETEHGFDDESHGRRERALEAYRRATAKGAHADADVRFARSYLLYALRHCDVDPAGKPVCH